MVERRHAECVGRRNVQTAADIVERARTDPSGAIVDGMQRRQQQMACVARSFPAMQRAHIADRLRSEQRIDCGDFVLGRLVFHEPYVHAYTAAASDAAVASSLPAKTFSSRTAAALNSAVPDCGSVASIVKMLVATSSLKWNVVKTRPARKPGSMRAGITTEPRRDVTRTGSPFSNPYSCASSGETSSVSPTRSGER